jgi:hypothetical protein
VKVLYREKYVKLFWRGDTRYFVYEVQPAGKAGSDPLSPPVLPSPRKPAGAGG